MPLTAKDAALFLPVGVEQKQVAPGIWLSSDRSDAPHTRLRTGSHSVLVNVQAAAVPGKFNTALGRALAFIRHEREAGQPVIISGPDAVLIIEALAQ